jgi:hypothetical protein
MKAIASAGNMLRSGWHRTCADFFMPSRLDLYSEFVRSAVDSGYEPHSILSFWRLIQLGECSPRSKYLILRHDVDNRDFCTTRQFWQIEYKLGLKSTFYFRLSTLAPRLMNEIYLSGFEVGYHYEEIATFAKERGFVRPEQASAALPEIRGRFKRNLFQLRETTGLPLVTVASHGDFANRKLGIPNTVILEDDALRKETNIECEAYDPALRSHVSTSHSDVQYPGGWCSEDPKEAVHRGEHVIHVLTHPRHWHADRIQNLIDEMNRIKEGFQYLIR